MVTDPESDPWLRLAVTIERILQRELCVLFRVIPCDRDQDGRYARNIGFEYARNLLVAEHYRTGSHPPLLLVGLFPISASRAGLDVAIHAMLTWSGISCLSHGFTRAQLIETARCVMKGAKTPLPAGLLPKVTVGDMLRLTAEIRHWLENRLRNTEGALSDFESAERGEIQLHRTHLYPLASISDEHRAMLNRLWALEVPAMQFAQRVGGIGPLKTAVAEFESRWQDLEAARVALRLSEGGHRKQDLAEAVAQFARVRDALQAIIVASRELDNEMIGAKASRDGD